MEKSGWRGCVDAGSPVEAMGAAEASRRSVACVVAVVVSVGSGEVAASEHAARSVRVHASAPLGARWGGGCGSTHTEASVRATRGGG